MASEGDLPTPKDGGGVGLCEGGCVDPFFMLLHAAKKPGSDALVGVAGVRLGAKFWATGFCEGACVKAFMLLHAAKKPGLDRGAFVGTADVCLGVRPFWDSCARCIFGDGAVEGLTFLVGGGVCCLFRGGGLCGFRSGVPEKPEKAACASLKNCDDSATSCFADFRGDADVVEFLFSGRTWAFGGGPENAAWTRFIFSDGTGAPAVFAVDEVDENDASKELLLSVANMLALSATDDLRF